MSGDTKLAAILGEAASATNTVETTRALVAPVTRLDHGATATVSANTVATKAGLAHVVSWSVSQGHAEPHRR